MGILDSLQGEDFLSGAFQALAGTAGALFQSSAEDDRIKEAQESQDKKDKLAMQLELLKLRYGSNGGGGGGGSAMQLTPAQRLAAMQNQGNAQSDSLKTLMAALQNSYGMGV